MYRTVLIEDLQNKSPGFISYFYFDNRDRIKTTYQGFLLSLVHQLASNKKGLHPILSGLYETCNQGGMQPSIKQLESILVQISKDLQLVYLVIDAMDECQERKPVLDFLQLLHEQQVHILTTSRHPVPDQHDSWIYLGLDDLKKEKEKDIKVYIDDKLSTRKLGPSLHKEVISTLVNGAQGQ